MSKGAPRNHATADAHRAAEDAASRVVRARRMAWSLGLVVIACYLGFIVFGLIQGPL